MNELKRTFGVVFVLDALGASHYSDDKIQKFLSARKRINDILISNAKVLATINNIQEPNTYTFGDTLIVVIPLTNDTKLPAHLHSSLMLMQNYLFYSLEEGILFRGAFSVGNYIEDSDSNTVMGEAVSDAASWYEKAEWMGLACTPKTNNIIEYYFDDQKFYDPLFLAFYPVPLKSGEKIDLYTVSWTGRFFQDKNMIKDPHRKFLEILKDHPIPFGTEKKIENTKNYFLTIANDILKNKE